MKKLMKNPIFMFILGFVIAVGVTSVLAYDLFAPNVGYTPKDDTWNVDNTKSALDDLYDVLGGDHIYFDSLNLSEAYGKQIKNRTTSVNLEDGEYLIIISYGFASTGWGSTSVYEGYDGSITCTNNCTIETIRSRRYYGRGNNAILWTNSGLFRVRVVDSSVLTYTVSTNDDNNNGQMINIYAIKMKHI